jgi:hypothetical protein
VLSRFEGTAFSEKSGSPRSLSAEGTTMNTPNAVAVEVPPNINEGLTLLTKRLSPAKLQVEGPEGKRNGFYFNTPGLSSQYDDRSSHRG